ncbi:MAG: hypothetical protein US57_C0001G0034 [Candidatus Moranbacteria bacterium GW2011_GWC2_37_73]|nr:MAG: hypothetical protein UR95_C0001G0041 [Parcubacteria group bacterium GW2011_GWC1_36_108]KKQ00703.1 MAG: hypothetical protein US09_C0007G0034 [Candidatus Moranbacteria bacterium GW2011_GWD1_36_198]KKQ01492.1 MAG: hypothetical protein US10_C0012G0013 [Candidatus Moranbacteria bacterium GW2011_GWD2_36_198]KKQ40424.1 MAG: hypothetical protein US57_C0001G0034 [Candidatus Moranbacteria bacterium GW2011_GWC2_37_73]HBU11048.1 hypothetical protein [Candidatus Moranbacteria bacterium]
MIGKIRALLFEAKILQKEVIFFISEGIFLAIFTYLIFNNANSLSDMGNYFHNVNVALFTILIPLAIAVLSDYFRDKRNGTAVNYSELDLIVIINSVFDVKLILITVLLSYLPSFFWAGSGFFVKNLLLIIWLVGLGILVKIILDFIIWIKNPYYHRFRFLDKIRESNEYILAWDSVWKAKENSKHNELKFFEIFSKNVNILIKIDKPNIFFNEFLRTFTNQIQNREKDILLYWGKESPFEKILEWYYKAETLHDERRQGFPFDYDIYPILEYVEVQSFDRSYSRYLQLVKKHLDKHSDDIEYVENFFSSFLSILLLNLNRISSELTFWKSYPEEWKINSNNLESEKIVPIVALREIILWSERRIADGFLDSQLGTANGLSYDSELNKVFYYLFSDTEPISWANIFSFLFYPDSDGRIEGLINTKRFFGGMGRFAMSWGGNSVESKAEAQYKNGLSENKKMLKFMHRMIPVVFPSKEDIKQDRGILLGYESEYMDDKNKLSRIKEYIFVLEVLEEFIDEANKK